MTLVPVLGHAEAPLLAAIFADHAVVQRDRPIAVFGTVAPGAEVTVALGTGTARATADAAGAWHASLPAMPAGGPFTLTARSGARLQTVGDVLVGDVWLCSGQSNIEWTVRNALNADWEAEHSANARIRHVTIGRNAAVQPRADFEPLAWKVAGPDTTKDFSAVCYYFARELQKSVDVPQGLIHASWGGTRIELWLSGGALRALGGHDAALDLLGEYGTNPGVGSWHWGMEFQKWWSAQPQTRGVQPWATGKAATGAWRPAPAELTEWERWGDPKLAAYDGMLWYRTRVTLTRAQAKQGAKLALGVIDDVDLVWVNGRPVATGFGEAERSYTLPANVLRAGENTIVVNDFDMWGSGGIHGPAGGRALQLADGTAVPLASWEYQLPPAGLPGQPRAPWEPIAGINLLYNGMIAPLRDYGLRGVAWYQGEANGSLEDAQRYEAQLRALFADWRRQFAAPLTFLVVQLANWNHLVTAPVDSGWARLRDAQRRAVAADGNAGLAVTMDIGNRDDIHPTNKQDVGKRLARAARHVAYGEKLSASGAVPKSAKRAGAGIAVQLGDYDGALQVIGARDPAGFELCGATQASCRFVRAQLGAEGIVTLEDADVADATRVRFCWADAPLCNLFDTDGLPVGPFEVSVDR